MHFPLHATAPLFAAGMLLCSSAALACPLPIRRPIHPNRVTTFPMEETAREFFEHAVLFESVARPVLTGYRCEQTIGDCSAWSRADTAEVVIVDLAESTAKKMRFPQEYGPIAAIGWKDGKELYVRLASSSYAATIVYLDPVLKTVRRVEYWRAELFTAAAR